MHCKIFKFYSRIFDHGRKRLDKKAEGNFKNFDVTDWQINNYTVNIAQYLKK